MDNQETRCGIAWADPIDSFRIEQIALRAVEDGAQVTAAEVQKMAASIIAYLDRHHESEAYRQYLKSSSKQPLSLR